MQTSSLEHEDRILFLKSFTEELIENSRPIIEIPYLPQHITTDELKKIIPIGQKKQIPPSLLLPPKLPPRQIFRPQLIRKPRPQFRPIQAQQMQPSIMSTQIPKIQAQQMQIPQQIVEPDLTKPLPQGFALGKLDKLIRDSYVNMIECPGPDKLILVRTMGQIKTTKISLSEQEIKDIVETFSQEARIPIMTGIFKAAVGNLLITAIISEFVGSRFIITKKLM